MTTWKLVGSELVVDEDAPDAPEASSEAFDPSGHNIDEVKAYIGEHPDDVQRVYDAEEAGKARSSLLDWLSAD